MYQAERLNQRVRRIVSMLTALDFTLLRYSMWVRFKGLDFAGASCEELGLPSARANQHAHSGGPHLQKVLESLEIPAGNNAVDFGSGKGLAAITLSRYFDEVTGVEMSSTLVDVARQNMKKLGICNVRFECADAGSFRGLDSLSYIYMFHPFPASVMDEVMDNVNRSLEKRPRPMTIIYKHPFCHDSIVKAGFVKRREFTFRYSHPFAIYTR